MKVRERSEREEGERGERERKHKEDTVGVHGVQRLDPEEV